MATDSSSLSASATSAIAGSAAIDELPLVARTVAPRPPRPASPEPEAVRPLVPQGRGQDGYAGRIGADVSMRTDDGVRWTYVSFDIDPTTQELHISILDGSGRLLRVIPPDSVSQMMEAMARYASTIG